VQERENKGFMVSVIIPAHNYAAYLPRAIKSCLDQSHRRLETIVVDDGSTDDTKDIVHTFGDRVVYLFQKNSGVSSARNAGLDRAAGDFIAFLDADDYLTEGSLEIRLNAFLKDPDVDFVVANTYSRRMNDGSLACHSALRKDFVSDKIDRMLLSRHLPFATCSVLMRSHVAKQFRVPLHLANGEDIAYFTKIFFGRKGSFLSQPVAAVCSHTDSLRHRMDEIGKQGSALVDTIFNDPYYHGVGRQRGCPKMSCEGNWGQPPQDIQDRLFDKAHPAVRQKDSIKVLLKVMYRLCTSLAIRLLLA